MLAVMRFALALALLFSASPAIAQDDAAVAEGRRLSEINCTRCHNIELQGESPLTDAPPFREIAKDYDRIELVDGFMEGLAVRHPLMPDWDVTEPQAEALASFVMSLGESGPRTGDSPAVRGRGILVASCARCHAAGLTGASPLPEAPPFRDVVKRYEPAALEEALAEGIVTGHEQMPQFAFPPEDVAAIVAYLETLKPE
jgi:mono/diheme cytochrome c family protein